MSEYKIYSMKLSLKAIRFEYFQEATFYSIKVTQNSQVKSINRLEMDSQGDINVNQIVEFQIEGECFKRDTQCVLQVMREGGRNTLEEEAYFEFYVMDYKNYSKKQFQMQSKKGGQVTLFMNINISSAESLKKICNIALLPTKVPNRLSVPSNQVNQGKTSKLKKTVKFEEPQDVKLQSKIQVGQQKEPASSLLEQVINLGLMQNVSVVVEQKKNDKEQMDCKPKKSRLSKKKSLYCQQIEQNINHMRDVDIGDRLATAASSIKQEDNFLQALNRMKNKLQIIQLNEQILNEVEEELQKQGETEHTRKKELRISQEVSFKYQHYENNHSHYTNLRRAKKYQLAKPNSGLMPCEQQKNDLTMTVSGVNRQIEEEQLKKLSYIKLSKISQLKKAANLSKDNNRSLIKANEQLKQAMDQMVKKFELSKKIIGDKQNMMKNDFVQIKKNMEKIINQLALKNQQSTLREQKIKGLQETIEAYVRENNQLKEELRISHAKIKQLKNLLSMKDDDTKNKTEENYEKLFNSRELKLDFSSKIPQEDLLNPFSALLYSQRKIQTDRDNKQTSKISFVRNSAQTNSERSNKSVEGASNSNSRFRKFSRNKMSSCNIGESEPVACKGKQELNMFKKISQILLGDQNRVLRNL